MQIRVKRAELGERGRGRVSVEGKARRRTCSPMDPFRWTGCNFAARQKGKQLSSAPSCSAKLSLSLVIACQAGSKSSQSAVLATHLAFPPGEPTHHPHTPSLSLYFQPALFPFHAVGFQERLFCSARATCTGRLCQTLSHVARHPSVGLSPPDSVATSVEPIFSPVAVSQHHA